VDNILFPEVTILALLASARLDGMTESAHCVLTIRHRSKGIPYSGFVRDDGINHGFMVLKGQPKEVIRAVPEASDMPELQEALVRLNASDTLVFTVGCEKAFNCEGENHWGRGYIEFAINSRELVVDAQHYFKLFFEFCSRLNAIRFRQPVQYCWELEPAAFTDLKTSGFTATIWITTAFLPDQAMARRVFGEALVTLVDFVCSLSARPLTNLY
jgi:hypothetical protein